MIESYQDEQALEQEAHQPDNASFAKIVDIYDDGVTLHFEGEDAPAQKHYAVNSFVVFSPGDRVRVLPDGKTYVVEYPIGAPRRVMTADTATSANTANKAGSADTATTAGSANTAKTADSAAYADRAGTADNAVKVEFDNRVKECYIADGAHSAQNFEYRHYGDRLGFFNSSGYYKQSVSQVSDTSSVQSVGSRLNALISALRSYGLV